MHGQSQLSSGLATLVVLALVVRRTLRTQTVHVWALVVVPIVLLAMACLVVAATPPTSVLGVVVIVVAGTVGAAVGYARGRHSKITLGPRPGTLVVQGDVVLVAILVAAFALRLIVRTSFAGGGPLTVALSDGFIVFAAGSVAVARGMLYFAWRRLVRTHMASMSRL